jgi:hypothetical protein
MTDVGGGEGVRRLVLLEDSAGAALVVAAPLG